MLCFVPNAFGEPTGAWRQAESGQGAATYASDARYYPNGIVDTYTFGNGYTHKTTLNTRQVPETTRDSKSGVTAVNFSYLYDNNLNIIRLTDHQNTAYSPGELSYDGLDRLVSGQGGSSIGNTQVSYDGLGNITGYSNLNSNLDYHYDTNGLLTSVSGTGRTYSAFSYDSRGNVLNNSHDNFSYNLANLMTDSGSNSYLYEGHGRRVRKASPLGSEYFLYSNAGQLVYAEKADGNTQNYIYLGNRLVAKDSGNSAITHVHTDIAGSVTAESDASGIVSKRFHYQAFGQVIGNEPSGEPGYTGHVHDSDIGLIYMQARYYDPVIGRFYSNDPIGFRDVHSFNRYAYANNNPYKYTDPTGTTSSALSMMRNQQNIRSIAQSNPTFHATATAWQATGVVAVAVAVAAVSSPVVAAAVVVGENAGLIDIPVKKPDIKPKSLNLKSGTVQTVDPNKLSTK